MIVKELKPDQRQGGRWLAVLSDGRKFQVGEAEVLEYSLYAGCELTDSQVEEMVEKGDRSRRQERAIDLLSRKPLSERELSDRMAKWGADDEEIFSVCQRMKELGYLDDLAYAMRVAEHYIDIGYGERRLRDEFYRRGIPRDLWDQALETQPDPADTVDAYVRKHLKDKSGDRKECKKVSDALARRGFSWTVISETVNRFRREEEMDREEEET